MEQKQLIGRAERSGSTSYGTTSKSPKVQMVVRHELAPSDRLESLALHYDVSVGEWCCMGDRVILVSHLRVR